MRKPSSTWGFAALSLVVIALVAACGSSGRGSYDDGTTPPGGSSGGIGDPALVAEGALSIEPADTDISVEDGKPLPSVDYHAFLVHKDGSREDVTANAVFRMVQNAGPVQATFAGPKLTASPNAVGKAKVHADLKTLSGEATLRIHLKKVIVAGGAPADAATKFGGAVDPARKPSIVYPSDGVMVPPNMNEIEWHYQPGAGNDLFDLAVKGALLDLDVYFACNAVGGGCAYSPDPTVWGILASAGRGDDPLATTLRGTSKAGGASVGASASQTIAFGEEDILGGIYYWNAGAGATMRYEFGVSGQKAETFMNAPKAGAAQCVGCHVLSRDGERISLGLDIPAPAAYKVFDVASKTMVFAQGGAAGGAGGNFFSFSPDKKQIMVSNGITMSLRDAATGAPVQDMVGEGAMPDWSPDGQSIVFAKSNQSPAVLRGHLRRDRRLRGLAVRPQERRRHVGQPDRPRGRGRTERVLSELLAGRRVGRLQPRLGRHEREGRDEELVRRAGRVALGGLGGRRQPGRARARRLDARRLVAEVDGPDAELPRQEAHVADVLDAPRLRPAPRRRPERADLDGGLRPRRRRAGQGPVVRRVLAAVPGDVERQPHRAVGHARRAPGMWRSLSVRGERGLHRHGLSSRRQVIGGERRGVRAEQRDGARQHHLT